MRRLGLLAIVAILLCGQTISSAPRGYSVVVTRKESNLYKVENTRLYVKTKFCYEYVYHADATLYYEQYGSDNSLYFVNSRTSCDVEKVLSE